MKVSLAASESADMMGFFIYQGRCYVQYEWIYDDMDMIGDYLGTATGLINDMDSARFVPCDGVPLDEGQDSIADTEELYHLYFI